MNTTDDGQAWIDALPPRTFLRADDLPINRSDAQRLLTRLAADPHEPIVRARRGLYWTTPPPTPFGTELPDPLAIAMEIGGPGAGPSTWAAANVLQLTTQVPATTTIAVVGRAPCGLRHIEFVSRANAHRRDLTPREIAVLEVLRQHPAYSDHGWPTAASRLVRLHDAGNIDLARIITVARHQRDRRTLTHAADLAVRLGNARS